MTIWFQARCSTERGVDLVGQFRGSFCLQPGVPEAEGLGVHTRWQETNIQG